MQLCKLQSVANEKNCSGQLLSCLDCHRVEPGQTMFNAEILRCLQESKWFQFDTYVYAIFGPAATLFWSRHIRQACSSVPSSCRSSEPTRALWAECRCNLLRPYHQGAGEQPMGLGLHVAYLFSAHSSTLMRNALSSFCASTFTASSPRPVSVSSRRSNTSCSTRQ